MGIQNGSRVVKLVTGHKWTNDNPRARENCEEHHNRTVDKILCGNIPLDKLVREVVGFDAYCYKASEPYMAMMLEALVVAYATKAEEFLLPIHECLGPSRELEMWLAIPAFIIGLLDATLWCHKNNVQISSGFVAGLPALLGSLIRFYIEDGCADLPEEQECSTWALGKFSGSFAAYLGSSNSSRLRCAHLIAAELDKCKKRIFPCVYPFLNQITHRLVSMIDLRDQIKMLNRELRELDKSS